MVVEDGRAEALVQYATQFGIWSLVLGSVSLLWFQSSGSKTLETTRATTCDITGTVIDVETEVGREGIVINMESEVGPRGSDVVHN
jgi:hypothetical protein